MTGRVFDIQRFCVHDGPGIRTTVFLKGCPMRCVWCHNPEGISSAPALSFVESACIGCGECARACPRGAHRVESGGHVLDRAACAACGTCAAACPAGALELVGRDRSVDDVMSAVLRDKAFYESSGGGLTLSGGEPAFQPEFSLALCAAARENGIHCAVETCGFAPEKVMRRFAAAADLFLFDVKETDPVLHREFTGVPLERVLENLRLLHDLGAAVRLRLPIVPGRNDRPTHHRNAARLARSLPRLRGVDTIPYHPLGLGKLARFGLNWSDANRVTGYSICLDRRRS